ncbi:hypothetical protein PO902_14180 [Planococcus maritimus]|nr:hypothetical protein [Planococcus sp. SK3692]MDE4086191.1 hypothetical protein [Planococcus maritimus]
MTNNNERNEYQEITVQLRQGDSVKVTRREQTEALREKEKRDRRRAEGGNFTFTDMQPMQKLADEVDALQLGYLFVLQTFIDYDTNALVVGRDKRPMTKKDMQAALNVGRTVFSGFLKTMELYSVVIQDAEGRFVINDEYLFRGSQGKRKRVVKAYDMGVRKVYEVVRSKKKVKQLGYVVKTLPYLHMKNNVVAANPFEEDDAKVQAFGKAELAELLGITEKALYTLIREMQFDGEHVFVALHRGKSCFFMVNPSICSRGEVNDSIRSLFKVKAKKSN